MRRSLTLGLCLICSCTLDTRPLGGSDTSASVGTGEQPRLARVPSISRSADAGQAVDAAPQQQDANDMTSVGSGRAQPDAGGARDSAMPAMEPMVTMPMMMPATPAASGGASGTPPVQAASGTGGAAGASGGGGAAGTPQGGAAAPPTSKDALIGLLNERASMSGTDAILVRSLIAQLDSPLPANSGTMRLLLTTALTSFGCRGSDSRECTVICDYVSDSCLACATDQQCREQLVLVCPSSLGGCIPGLP